MEKVLGHNIRGCPVTRIKTIERNFGKRVEEMLKKLKHASDNTPGNHLKLWPNNICVLCESSAVYCKLEEYLLQSGLPIGSIEQQLVDGNVVALGEVQQSLSYEWPVVIYVTTNTEGRDCQANIYLKTTGEARKMDDYRKYRRQKLRRHNFRYHKFHRQIFRHSKIRREKFGRQTFCRQEVSLSDFSSSEISLSKVSLSQNSSSDIWSPEISSSQS